MASKVVLLILCLLACELVVRGLPRLRWGLGTVLVLATAASTTLPGAISAVAGSRQLVFDPASRTMVLAEPWSDDLNRILMYALSCVALIVLVIGWRRRWPAGSRSGGRWHARVRNSLVGQGPSLLALGVWMTTVLGAVRAGDQPLKLQSVALAMVLVAAVVSPLEEHTARTVALVGLLTAAASTGIAVLRPDQAFRPCEGKCGWSGELLTGIFTNENALALAIAIAIPFVWMAFRGWRSWYSVAVLFAVIMATGSRTGMIAAGVTLAVLAVSQPRLDRPAARVWPLAGVAGVATVAGLLIPFLRLPPSTFTGRGELWSFAIDHLNIWLGSGPLRWALLAKETGKIPAAGTYSVHNQWLDVLFQAGLPGLLLFSAVLVAILKRSLLPAALAVLLPMLIIGITERPWSVAQVDWLTFAYLGALLFVAGDVTRGPQSVSAEVQEHSPGQVGERT